MPRKSKTKPKTTEPAITVKAASPLPPVEPPLETQIRCIWDSRLIVGGDKTPSGTRYEFETDQIKNVNAKDYQFLLDMRANAPGCCGGYGGSPMNSQKFFSEV